MKEIFGSNYDNVPCIYALEAPKCLEMFQTRSLTVLLYTFRRYPKKWTKDLFSISKTFRNLDVFNTLEYESSVISNRKKKIQHVKNLRQNPYLEQGPTCPKKERNPQKTTTISSSTIPRSTCDLFNQGFTWHKTIQIFHRVKKFD